MRRTFKNHNHPQAQVLHSFNQCSPSLPYHSTTHSNWPLRTQATVSPGSEKVQPTNQQTLPLPGTIFPKVSKTHMEENHSWSQPNTETKWTNQHSSRLQRSGAACQSLKNAHQSGQRREECQEHCSRTERGQINWNPSSGRGNSDRNSSRQIHKLELFNATARTKWNLNSAFIQSKITNISNKR